MFILFNIQIQQLHTGQCSLAAFKNHLQSSRVTLYISIKLSPFNVKERDLPLPVSFYHLPWRPKRVGIRNQQDLEGHRLLTSFKFPVTPFFSSPSEAQKIVHQYASLLDKAVVKFRVIWDLLTYKRTNKPSLCSYQTWVVHQVFLYESNQIKALNVGGKDC